MVSRFYILGSTYKAHRLGLQMGFNMLGLTNKILQNYQVLQIMLELPHTLKRRQLLLATLLGLG